MEFTIELASQSSSWPAWVQAIGSIFAILVAVAVAAWQRWLESNDRKYKEQLVARTIALKGLIALSDEADRALKALEYLKSCLNRESHFVDTAPKYNEINIPKELTELSDKFHDAGPMGERLQGAYIHIIALRILVGDVVDGNQTDLDEIVKSGERHFNEIDTCVDKLLDVFPELAERREKANAQKT